MPYNVEVAGNPQAEAPCSVELDRLTKNLAQLEETMIEVEKRLSPALRPSPATLSSGKPPAAEVHSTLVENLCGANQRIGAVHDKLVGLLRQLEL